MRGSHVTKWQSHRKISLGPVRRACPASGASWNVQVVRGKMTSKCLWHACQALAIGFLLMIIGAGMATIGYYAEHIADNKDIKDNVTVPVRSETRGINLHNLSYAGPIVMGFGGFIIVAACVMTFEARDSASKVVPARFKLNYGKHDNSARSSNADRRPTGLSLNSTSQTHHDSKSSSIEMHSNEHSQHEQQQVAQVHGCKSHSKSDGIRSNAARLKGQPFRTMSACSSLEAQHSIEHKQTQTSNMDVKMCHVNERKASKSTNSSNSNGHKRPSSLKLPESQGKTRAKHLYRSRTKPEEPTTSGISPKLSEQRNTVGHHIDNGHADEIFVISTEADVQ